jgi:DNA-binding MarR family transcriptional regulator
MLPRAQLRKQLACEAALVEAGLTLPQWGMLYAVAIDPESSTHALALFIGQSDQSAGAVVARLEQRRARVQDGRRQGDSAQDHAGWRPTRSALRRHCR